MLRKITQLAKKWRYEIVAFGVGMSVMILEIVGARLIAPHLGSSIYVWTAMIGVILGALALGYWIGGRFADKPNAPDMLHIHLLVAAVIILCLSFVYEPVLSWLSTLTLDLRISAFAAAAVLFAPPSFFLGCVSPLLAKVRVTDLRRTGHAVGRLEAAGTAGSIAGTFFAGYFLLAVMGSHRIVLCLAIFLMVVSFAVNSRQLRAARIILLLLTVLILAAPTSNAAGLIADVDTAYSRYRVVQGSAYGQFGTFLLSENSGIQSGYNPDQPNSMIFPYTQRFMDVAEQLQPERILMIGGGAHTFASAYARTHADAKLDVVEIDPALDQIARNHFGFTSSPRLRIIHADGRTFLNTSTQKYDLLILDAFVGHTPPFQLVTAEAATKMRGLLKPGGAVVVNFIARGSPTDAYFSRFVSTYRSVFPQVAVYAASGAASFSDEQQNFVLIATIDVTTLQRITLPAATALPPQGQVLRDDFAPVEQLAR